jgi:hypothetical protein
MSITNVLLLAVLYAALAFALNLTVGTLDENRQLMSYLAIALLAQRLAWILLWADMTQSIQTRNREDSFFWWMTPYFFRMMIKTFFDWNTTFIFRSVTIIVLALSFHHFTNNFFFFAKRRFCCKFSVLEDFFLQKKNYINNYFSKKITTI